jgi:sporulation-control protein spo0M
MGFFSKLKAAVGIGGAKVALLLNQKTFSPGETVEGTITLNGGSVEQTVEELRVELLERWEVISSSQSTSSVAMNLSVSTNENGEIVTETTDNKTDDADPFDDPFFKEEKAEEKDPFDDPFFKEEEESTEESDEEDVFDDPFFADESNTEVANTTEHHSRKVVDLKLAENLTVAEGFEQNYSFSFTIPEDAISSDSKREWVVYAWAGIPKAVDPTARETITVN